MILDSEIRAQLEQYLQMMEGDVLLKVSAGDDPVSKDMLSLMDSCPACLLASKLRKQNYPEPQALL